MQTDINHYLDSWMKYKIDCELRIKGKAKLNNEGWRKLRQYHLEQYVSSLSAPFGFMFALRYKYKSIYRQISCANAVYRICLLKRQESFNVRSY